jgi:hypothetical protein
MGAGIPFGHQKAQNTVWPNCANGQGGGDSGIETATDTQDDAIAFQAFHLIVDELLYDPCD